MNKVTLLINGVSLPYHVLDKGLEYAKGGGLPVKVVFVYENVDEADYELSPDAEEVSKADLSDANAAKNLEELIQNNSAYVDIFFANNDISHEIEVLKNPTIEEIARSLNDVERIFIDHESFTHPDEFAYINFSLEDLEENIAAKIERCSRPE